MDKTKRDLIIASVLVVCMAFLFAKIIFGGKAKAPKSPAAAEAAQPEDIRLKNLLFVTEIRQNNAVLAKQNKFWDGEFGRDPFVGETAVSSGSDAQNLVLKGVFWDEQNPKVLVNDTMLQIGDVIIGYKVTEIHPKSAVLRMGDKSLELGLFQSPIGDSHSS